jgi:3-oxoacyl-[acyl-carrier protein] reductase
MEKKHAIITGASRGIGRALAFGFAEAGYDLTITCIHSEDKLDGLAAELTDRYGIECSTFTGDLSKYKNVEMMFDGVDDVDVLVNNAGISYVGLLHEMSETDWNNVVSTNLSSAFYCSKFAIPLMLRNKAGKILNISSVWGDKGASMEVAYSASKGGLNAFTRALARELAPSNIQVNAIACGLIDTDMNRVFNEEEISSITEEIPADRIGQPDEVAKLAVQLCTGNSYLTGQVITLDGGWT